MESSFSGFLSFLKSENGSHCIPSRDNGCGPAYGPQMEYTNLQIMQRRPTRFENAERVTRSACQQGTRSEIAAIEFWSNETDNRSRGPDDPIRQGAGQQKKAHPQRIAGGNQHCLDSVGIQRCEPTAAVDEDGRKSWVIGNEEIARTIVFQPGKGLYTERLSDLSTHADYIVPGVNAHGQTGGLGFHGARVFVPVQRPGLPRKRARISSW